MIFVEEEGVELGFKFLKCQLGLRVKILCEAPTFKISGNYIQRVAVPKLT